MLPPQIKLNNFQKVHCLGICVTLPVQAVLSNSHASSEKQYKNNALAFL
jgi:sulfite exporter TauE/SafE